MSGSAVSALLDWNKKRGVWECYMQSHPLYREFMEARDRVMAEKPASRDVMEAFGYLYPEERDLFSGFWEAHPPPEEWEGPLWVANIGAGAGTSGLAWIESSPRVNLVTVDKTDGSSPFGCLEGERNAFTNAGLGDLAGDRWFQAHGPSIKVAEQLLSMQPQDGVHWPMGCPFHVVMPGYDSPDGVAVWDGAEPFFDVVFIDGDHSFEGCMGDLERWSEMVPVGGWILVHDYRKSEYAGDPRKGWDWSGVDRAVDRWAEENAGRWEQHKTVGTIAVLERVE